MQQGWAFSWRAGRLRLGPDLWAGEQEGWDLDLTCGPGLGLQLLLHALVARLMRVVLLQTLPGCYGCHVATVRLMDWWTSAMLGVAMLRPTGGKSETETNNKDPSKEPMWAMPSNPLTFSRKLAVFATSS